MDFPAYDASSVRSFRFSLLLGFFDPRRDGGRTVKESRRINPSYRYFLGDLCLLAQPKHKKSLLEFVLPTKYDRLQEALQVFNPC